ncbi:MAG: hypothetical protein R2864_01540 [Syntrophotaleaceae bacterium]
MFLVMKISFDRGFLRYINDIEQARLTQLGDSLQTAYANHGSWEFLRDNPRPGLGCKQTRCPKVYRAPSP